MAWFYALLGGLISLLCGSPVQQQPPPEQYGLERIRYYTRPHRESVPPTPELPLELPPKFPPKLPPKLPPKPPPRLPPRPQRVHTVPEPATYQWTQPQIQLQSAEQYGLEQTRYHARPHDISASSPPELPPRPSHIQRVDIPPRPALYQRSEPQIQPQIQPPPPAKLQPRQQHGLEETQCCIKPHDVSVSPPSELPPRPSRPQCVDTATPSALYQWPDPQTKLQLFERYVLGQTQHNARPEGIPTTPPPELPQSPSYEQRVDTALRPALYQSPEPQLQPQIQPQSESQPQQQSPDQSQYYTSPHYISVSPPLELSPRPAHTQCVDTAPLPALLQWQQPQIQPQSQSQSPLLPRYEIQPLFSADELPARIQQRPSPKQRISQNQVNQQNVYYRSLRDRAIEESHAMIKSFQGRRQASANGNPAIAAELFKEAKRHQAEMVRLNKEASEWIFTENNKDSQPGEVDLHGLYVKEAVAFAQRSIQAARNSGDTQISFIVGKGLHSRGRAKIKPAIQGLMHKYALVVKADPSNAGVLIVRLEGRAHDVGRVVRSDSIVNCEW